MSSGSSQEDAFEAGDNTGEGDSEGYLDGGYDVIDKATVPTVVQPPQTWWPRTKTRFLNFGRRHPEIKQGFQLVVTVAEYPYTIVLELPRVGDKIEWLRTCSDEERKEWVKRQVFRTLMFGAAYTVKTLISGQVLNLVDGISFVIKEALKKNPAAEAEPADDDKLQINGEIITFTFESESESETATQNPNPAHDLSLQLIDDYCAAGPSSSSTPVLHAGSFDCTPKFHEDLESLQLIDDYCTPSTSSAPVHYGGESSSSNLTPKIHVKFEKLESLQIIDVYCAGPSSSSAAVRSGSSDPAWKCHVRFEKVESERPSSGSGEPAPVIVCGDDESLASLKIPWTFWYGSPWAKSAMYPIHTISSVEEFCAVYSVIRQPSNLDPEWDLYFFKDKIKPELEDPVCANGGKWSLTFSRGKSDASWLRTLLALIGEQFGHGDEICGAVVNVGDRQEKIALWIKNAANEAAQMSIGKQWKGFLDSNETIGFIFHEDARQDESSTCKE